MKRLKRYPNTICGARLVLDLNKWLKKNTNKNLFETGTLNLVPITDDKMELLLLLGIIMVLWL